MADVGARKMRAGAVLLVLMALAGYSKAEREFYPALIFPSFGGVLEQGGAHTFASSVVRLHTDEGSVDVAIDDWFAGAPSSVGDKLADGLASLPQQNADWLFGRALGHTAACVERIEIVLLANDHRPEIIENSFGGSCP